MNHKRSLRSRENVDVGGSAGVMFDSSVHFVAEQKGGPGAELSSCGATKAHTPTEENSIDE